MAEWRSCQQFPDPFNVACKYLTISRSTENCCHPLSEIHPCGVRELRSTGKRSAVPFLDAVTCLVTIDGVYIGN
jgi:hypothetical protein